MQKLGITNLNVSKVRYVKELCKKLSFLEDISNKSFKV